MARIFDNIDPKKTNIPNKADNAEQYQEVQERSSELMDRHTKNFLDKTQDDQYADISEVNKSTGQLMTEKMFSDVDIEKSAKDSLIENHGKSWDANSIYKTWLGEVGEGFMRGVGQTISSNGDLVNFVGAAIPGVTMLEGNLIGNALNNWGDNIEDEHMTYLKSKLEGKEITWNSLADADFWSTNVSEMIPLALEFLLTGAAAGAVAKNAGKYFAKKVGGSLLKTGARQTVVGSAEALAGMGEKALDVVGSGRGLTKHLLRNVGGVGELTELGKSAASMVGAGLSNNLMAGAMNGMELHKQMQSDNKAAIAQGKEALYSEEDMANAAAGTVRNNMAYSFIDMLSWGVTYGKFGEKAYAQMTKSMLRPAEEVVKQASGGFKQATWGIFKGLAKAGGHGLAEGYEETYQETFENWAAAKAKAEITGEEVPDYFDYYQSKDNTATKVLSMAVGGLMGGTMNLKSAFNKNADNALNYMNRNEMLSKSAGFDKKGQMYQEFHIHNQMLDLMNEGKEDLFDGFMTSLVENEVINEDQVLQYKETFDKVGEVFQEAKDLNIAGKHALMNETVKSMVSKESFLRNQEEMNRKITDVKAKFNPGPEVDTMIEKITKDHKQVADALNIKIAFAEQNKLNLISGKQADPLEVAFVVGKNGQEKMIFPKYMTGSDLKRAESKGGIVTGLSEEQYERFVTMPDEELYRQAEQTYKNAIKDMGSKTKAIFDSLGGQEAVNTVVDKANELIGKVKGALSPEEELGTELAPEEVVAKEEQLNAILSKKEEQMTPVQNEGEEEVPAMTEEEWRQTAEGQTATAIEQELENNKQVAEKNKTILEAKKQKITSGADGSVDESRNLKLENTFETDNIEADQIDNKKTLKEVEQERIVEAEKEFLKDNNKGELQEDTKSYTAEEENGVWYANDIDGERMTVNGKVRTFQSEEAAQRAIARRKSEDAKNNVAPRGKASLGSAVVKGSKTVLGAVGSATMYGAKKIFNKAKEQVDPALLEKINREVAQRRSKLLHENNKRKDEMRKGIIRQANLNKGVSAQMANPDIEVQKSELDKYLNTTIAKFKYGPSDIQKQIVINRNLRRKGINIDVNTVDNLMSIIGVPALGYSIASSIFIDADAPNQEEIFMHEMAHVNYRVTKNEAPTMALVKRAYENKALVKQVKKDYKEHIVYDFPTGQKSLLNFMIEDMEYSYSEAMDQINDQDVNLLAQFENPTESPIESQETINEELFAFTIQGPMAQQYNEFFQPIKEFGRKKETKSWNAWLKDKSVVYEENDIDVITSLNNGKRVATQDLYDHIMKGFEKALVDEGKGVFSTRGFASKIAQNKAAEKQRQKEISERKISEQASYDPKEMKRRDQTSLYDRTIAKIKESFRKQDDWTDQQKDNAINHALEELEGKMMEGGSFDDFEMAKATSFRGATAILNNFTKSLNYIKRQRFLKNPENVAADFDTDKLVDRDELISEIFNLAFETKGNTNDFIDAIENSPIHEISMFNQYMDKLYPGQKTMILSSMGFVMGNTQTISAIRNYVNAKGEFETVNALSETEKNKVDSHINYLMNQAVDYNSAIQNNTEPPARYEAFINSITNLKNQKGSNQDYLNILKAISPYGVKYSELIKSNTINIRGTNGSVKYVIDNLVKNGNIFNANGSVYVGNLRPFIEAVVDSNRKFTSYSVVQNAEGNFEPSKITNNHLLSQVNEMIDFLSSKKGVTLQAFKEEFGHINNPKLRKSHNPVLESIYNNFKNGRTIPGITQYMGLDHAMAGKSSLYKNSTDFTQTLEDFLLFANPNRPNSAEYQQSLGAMADSPRKFMMAVKRLTFDDMFSKEKKGGLSLEGKNQMENAWNIYKGLNQNVTDREGLIESKEDFIQSFYGEVRKEIAKWEEHGIDLYKNNTVGVGKGKSFENYFSKEGKMSIAGKRKITEYVFNQAVNGLALAEIFNPGVSTKDIVKRNKGNSSPVMSTGNKNLRIEAIPINDAAVKGATDSGMYILEEDAKKIVAAGMGVFDLNEGLKLMNYSVERNNPNFKNRAAYFKGYTTIISKQTLETEPGLKGIYELLMQRREKYHGDYYDKHGVAPSEDLLNGQENYLNVAIPHSAVKSDFYSPEQLEAIKEMTFENLNNELSNPNNRFEKYNSILDSLYYDNGVFKGLSGENFGPQQIMDKTTKESPTPVQFISSLIVNGSTQGTLLQAEEIQRLIRTDMSNNLDDILKELNNMNPASYKTFIMKNLDLENMDQRQRLIIEENMVNLSHPAVADFVRNTLANRLKMAGNKLKTEGTIAQQKPSLHYKLRNGYKVIGGDGKLTDTLRGYTDKINPDGSRGSNPLEIVLPAHMREGKEAVKARTYFTFDSTEVKEILNSKQLTREEYEKGSNSQKLEILKRIALNEAGLRFVNRNDNNPNRKKINLSEKVGAVMKGGETVGYYVRGENVLATRIPAHGPASTGVFEVIDFLEGKGNQTIVHHEFSEVVGSDYDGDSLFIQKKSKSNPNFSEAIDRTAELWNSPEMYAQIRAKMDFKEEVEKVIKNNGITVEANFPMSPGFNRDAYNNTMISKRNIGIIFNTHRIANYLAAYEVKLNDPIHVNGKEINSFKDGGVGMESRNNQSAMLANIILDNAKFHYADKLGLNSQTINQYSLLINMGLSLKDVSAIMTSDAVKSWTRFKMNNESPYLTRRTASELNEQIFSSLGIDKSMSASYSINTSPDKINSDQNKRNIIAVMEYIEKMNADILKVSKIMAGHEGIENNPFILENQIKEFDEVVKGGNKETKSLLNFSEDFKNNPDLKSYRNNAEKILDVMKKANNIYRTSTSKLVENLNEKLGYDGMNSRQLERASDIIKKFVNSRILGLNNISAEEKSAKKKELMKQLNEYIHTMIDVTDSNGRSAFEKSLLFQKALNIHFSKDGKNDYVSANPRFFNESLGEVEKQTIQREFMELPKEIKDNLIVLDLMNNGLTGPLSLTNVFDQGINADLSSYAAYDSISKNEPISKSVMDRLEQLIVTNEFNSPEGNIPYVYSRKDFKEDKILEYIQANGGGYLYQSMLRGTPTYFKINNKAYQFDGISKNEIDHINQMVSGQARIDAKKDLIVSKIKPYEKFEGDVNLEAISISDNKSFHPYKTYDSMNYDAKADHIVETNILLSEKKKISSDAPGGKFFKSDYHNYNDVAPLTLSEFERVMEFNKSVSTEQRQALYRTYQKDKQEANELAKKINQLTVSKMDFNTLVNHYSNYAPKDLYAYSIITTPIIIEITNRASAEQSRITENIEDGSDIPLMSSWFDNNNIPSNHPATQSVVRQINENYKKFVKERGVYIKRINQVTEALYQEKFHLSKIKLVAFVQRAYQSVIADRSNVYERLYGNLVEVNTIKLPEGKTRKEFKFKAKEDIEQDHKKGIITDAEKNFYDVFRQTTEHLGKFDPNGKKRRDYIPHTAMNTFEMFSTRGLLGVLVNSKGSEEGMNDVKVYQNQNGQKTLVSFSDVKNNFNAMALTKENDFKKIREFSSLKRKAKKLLKEGKNEDGTNIEFSHMQNATLLDMSPMSRFSSSRSVKAEEMPSMDLNKALIDYVHASLFANGNEGFQGFKKMMPLIDGVLAYNDKNGYKNAYNYTKEVIKDGFIMKKDQDLFGPTADKVINGFVKGNTFYALGYKGLLIGKGLYAVGNVAIGKYMNIKREGGKSWAEGEKRYWGIDKGVGIESLDRRRRANNILKNLGFMDIDLHDDVSIETKSGLDGIFSGLALLPMAATEDWIQKTHYLGLLTQEEFDSFDANGNFKQRNWIPEGRILEIEERVKQSHGKGYSPTDQSRIQKYSLGRAFMQFSRHIPSQIRERFAKEDVDIYGKKYIGSLRQLYGTATTIFNNGMTPEKYKEYRKTLKPHEKDALDSALRGIAMMGVLGMVASASDSEGKLSAGGIADGTVSDANVHFDPEKLSFKMVPPALRSTIAITNSFWGSGKNEAPE